jgi:hypothetical protein
VHCSLNVASSSVSLNPTNTYASVTLNLTLTLQPSAVGPQNVYAVVYDNGWNINSSPSYSMAWWSAFNLLTSRPPAVSMASAPVKVPSQVLHYQVSDGNGYTYIMSAGTNLAKDSSGTNSPCWVSFTPPNFVTLYQMVNGSGTFLGEGYIGGSWSYPSTNGVIGGSGGLPGPGTCSIDLNQSRVYTSTDGTYTLQDPNAGLVTNLYLDLWTGLDSTAQGTLPLNVYLSAGDAAGQSSSNLNVGTWATLETVSTPTAPSGPSSGVTGAAYSFSTGGSVSSIGNPVVYQFNWGDGAASGWLPQNATSASHAWTSVGTGTYTVTAQAQTANTLIQSSTSSSTIGISIPTYTLVATATSGGSIQLCVPADDPPCTGGGGLFAIGTVVTVQATPYANYYFTGFTGALTGTQNPQTITITGLTR